MKNEKVVESIKSTINTNELAEYINDYKEMVTDLASEDEKFTSDYINAALLKIVTDAKNKDLEKKAKQEAKDKEDALKAEKENSVQRFFINIGLMDNLDKDSLKKIIMDNVTGISDSDFSDVYLKDSFSFFELPKEHNDEVLEKINQLKVGERDVHVELSEKRDRSSSRGGRPSRRDSFSRGGRGGDRGGYRSHDDNRGGYRSHDDSRGSYRPHDDNRDNGYSSRGDDQRRGGYSSHSDDRRPSCDYDNRGSSYRSNNDYSHENPNSYSESKKSRFSDSRRPSRNYKRDR